MAKTRSIIELSGTLGAITFVHSKAYGPHARAKRGTYIPVQLSEGMKASSREQERCNKSAKVIFDAIQAFMPGFKDGKLWNRLVSVLRRSLKRDNHLSYSCLNLFEVREDYPFSKHFQAQINFQSGSECAVACRQLSNRPGTYRISLIRIDADENLANGHISWSNFIDISSQSSLLNFPFESIASNRQSVYLIKFEQIKQGQPSTLLKDQGALLLNYF